jgi:SAM-dependent methyltransferase
MDKLKSTFSFGKNWVDYVENFVEEDRIKNAEQSLLQYLPREEYKDKVFIDIGCGSGIFSLSALRLGCSKVISFDVDRYSIEATKKVKNRFSYLLPEDYLWEIFTGDVLDENLISRLEKSGDIVYSWGVLHHTGNMWKAIKNASRLVKSSGFFIIAIYNKTSSSAYWLKVKRFYNSAPKFIKLLLVYFYFFCITCKRAMTHLLELISGKEKKLRWDKLFGQRRGMSTFYDIIDWLGGYPYEYASFEEVKDFVESLGFQLIKAPTTLPSIKGKVSFLSIFSLYNTGNNEFVFKKIQHL